MFRLYDGLALRASLPHVYGNPVAAIKHINSITCQTQDNLFADEIKGHGILVHSVRDKVIAAYMQLPGPNRGFVGCFGKGRMNSFSSER